MDSTTNANSFKSLLDFFTQVIDTYDRKNKKAADLVYLEFQNAVDKVSNGRQLAKVNAQDIQDDEAQGILYTCLSSRNMFLQG